MSDRPRLFDDLAGVAGGAISAIAGVREEANALVRSRVDEALAHLQVVRREEFEVVREMAANARLANEDAERRIAALEQRVSELENRLSGRSDGYAPSQSAFTSGSNDVGSGFVG